MTAVENRVDESGRAENTRRTLTLINFAHALDHFVLLIFPTAVLAIAADTGLAYGDLIALSTGAFVAFGALSLPAGYAAKWLGRRNMLAIFYFGVAASCAGIATAQSPLTFSLWLLALGSFAAIYHPVGTAMLVNTAGRSVGRALGVHGVWGNIGAALASGVTAWTATLLGWQAAFLVPALVAGIVGVVFLSTVPDERDDNGAHKPAVAASASLPADHRILLAAIFVLGVVCAGMTFNILTVALPKVIDERLGLALPLWLVGSLATGVFIFGALTQLTVGRLIERVTLPVLFAGLAFIQPLGFGLAAATTGVPLLVGLIAAMASIYGIVIVLDAMVARYVPDVQRSQAYGLRYFLSFAASGFAVPLIAYLHKLGGFTTVLTATSAFAMLLFVAAVVVMKLMEEQKVQMPEGA